MCMIWQHAYIYICMRPVQLMMPNFFSLATHVRMHVRFSLRQFAAAYVCRIVINIPGGTDATKGEEVVEYMGPRPPVGIHRYVLVLFEQKTRVHAEAPGDRANFKTRAFAAAHELGLPTAVVYFNAQKEPASRRR
ncbi:Protein MOTHER of FT and TFL1 [Zea mays]|uniref:Protein MOTHER of FT and TFL1 n=1 Tax=Zea mays TaxID=4577 RepID=A0A1D6FCZ7_MAIZE|nr:Protein MOTHER of FT and TFL1 [Zea mays]